MTIGERISQKRKELGLSQEALGEELGVSRQSIYKWESDAALPEIEKIIKLSRRFGVSVGWLLGEETEEAPEQAAAPELSDEQLERIGELLRQYIDAGAARQQRKPRRWPFVLLIAALLIAFIAVFSRLAELRTEYRSLSSSINYIQTNTQRQISSITSSVQNALDNYNSITVTDSVVITGTDYAANTVTFRMEAMPKTYTADQTCVFHIDYGGGTIDVPGAFAEGAGYRAEADCPLTDDIAISATFITGDVSELQPLKSYGALYSCSLETYESYVPLDWDINENTLLAETVFAQQQGSGYSVYDGIRAAETARVRMGLFRDQTLVAWYEQTEKPENYQGFPEDGSYLYFRHDAIPLTGPGVYCEAVVVEDVYGRTVVYANAPGVEVPAAGADARRTDLQIDAERWVYD